MWTWLTKVLVLIGLFLLTAFFSVIPIQIVSVSQKQNPRRQERFKKVISCLTVFSAGIFLGTCLLDLFPDMRETLDLALKDTNTYGFPVAEFIMSIGFFIILIIEQLVLSCKEGPGDDHETLSEPVSRSQSIRHRSVLSQTRSSSAPPRPMSNRMSRASHRGESGEPCNHVEVNIQPSGYHSDDNLTGNETDPLFPDRAVRVNYLDPNGFDAEFRQRSASMSSVRSILSNAFSTKALDETEQSLHVDANSHARIRSFLMLMALSLHSVFEGLAIGLQTSVPNVLSIFGAVVIHKCILAFSLGLNLVSSGMSIKKILMSNMGFCLASPTGIAIGILVDTVTSPKLMNLLNGILQGIACGTFLYVTFFEVLPHEFSHKGNRILKLLFLVIGFSTMVALVFMDKMLSPA